MSIIKETCTNIILKTFHLKFLITLNVSGDSVYKKYITVFAWSLL